MTKPSFFVDTDDLIVERLSSALELDILDLEDAVRSGVLAARLNELRGKGGSVPFIRFLECVERKQALDLDNYGCAEGRACLIAACHYYFGF